MSVVLVASSAMTRMLRSEGSELPVTVHPDPRPLILEIDPLRNFARVSRWAAVTLSPLISTGMPGGYGQI